MPKQNNKKNKNPFTLEQELRKISDRMYVKTGYNLPFFITHLLLNFDEFLIPIQNPQSLLIKEKMHELEILCLIFQEACK